MFTAAGSFASWAAYLFLIFLRVSSLFVLSPFLGRNVPRFIKVILSIMLSYIIIGVFPVSYTHLLEPIAKKMDKSMWTSSKKVIPNAENSKKIKSKLANNKFSIIMKFKDISMPLNDIVNLQPGDVLRRCV